MAMAKIITRVGGMLIALAVLSACGHDSGESKASHSKGPKTPEAGFQKMCAAAADGDLGAFFDMCDTKGQSGLLEAAASLITMELAARRPMRSGDIVGIKQAFREELGIDPGEMETADRDYASRRKYFLLFMEKSRGTARDALKEALREIAKAELVSSAMQGEDVARLRIRSDAGEKTWYMVRENGRWVMAGGLSPRKPD